MLDRSIPFYNTILRCDDYQPKDIFLPQGYSIVPYKVGYEKEWARLEFSIGDFDSLSEAESYFISTYTHDNDRLFQNVRFLLNENNEVIGSCIAWQDKRKDAYVSSLHWLIVDPKYQGLGFGRALCCDIMNIFAEQNALPIYLHTQPWSWKAILLYLSMGFKLQSTDTFAQYTNEYEKAIKTLKNIVSDEQFKVLIESTTN